MKVDKQVLRKQALALADAGGRNIAAILSATFDISRQAANAHLARLVEGRELVGEGTTKARVYHLATISEIEKSFPRHGLAEDRVWRTLFAPVVSDLPENVRDIWHYAMTEMINNAIDHSGSRDVHVGMRRNALQTLGWVADDGVGIFLKIQKSLGLFDPRESILELAKGKVTSDPEHHTGEGIFFVSKMFDAFEIRSGDLDFLSAAGNEDHLFERAKGAPGTLVMMKLENESDRLQKDVFDRFAAPDEYTFDRTIVPVHLAQYEGEKLVSRSQAKRLTLRFEKFRAVALDFTGVETIGQAFADEVFRVFQAAHPQIQLIPFLMTAAVEGMVKRALAGAKKPPGRA